MIGRTPRHCERRCLLPEDTQKVMWKRLWNSGLRYFVAVAEAENVSRAALKLHVSQPPLSRQIRDLENELGFLLLKRTAKSVSLTEAGRTFLNEARAVLQRADEGVKKPRAVATAGESDLHVGYSPTPFAEILPKTLRGFQSAMPKV